MKTRAQKETSLDQLKETFGSATTIVAVHYRGMTVTEISKLRKSARASGAQFQVAKNTLSRIAAKGGKFEGLTPYLKGPTALMTSQDAVSAAKVAQDFAKENEKLIILGGVIDGKVLNAAGVDTLANTPSLDQSRSQIVGLLTAAATKVVGVLQAPAGQLARVCNAYAQK